MYIQTYICIYQLRRCIIKFSAIFAIYLSPKTNERLISNVIALLVSPQNHACNGAFCFSGLNSWKSRTKVRGDTKYRMCVIHEAADGKQLNRTWPRIWARADCTECADLGRGQTATILHILLSMVSHNAYSLTKQLSNCLPTRAYFYSIMN